MRVRRTKPNSFETILIIEMQVENKHFKNIFFFLSNNKLHKFITYRLQAPRE